jgi:DHA2 family multidrug resistance protein-like MFS transporter
MCTSLVLVVMSVSGLNVSLPTLQEDLGATATQLQWIVDAYAIVFAGLLLTAGALGDRFGRKGALLVGLVVFGSASGLAALADRPEQVIAVRSVMGIGAALIMPATLSLIVAIFPPQERGRAIAVWAGFAGAGGALGPLVVGALLERYWWGSAFLVNVVVVVIVLTAVSILAPRSKDEGATPLDPLGAVLSVVGLAALLFGIIEGPEEGWTSGRVVAGFVVAVVVLSAFFLWERRNPTAMLPLGFFRDIRFSVGTGVITFAFFAMFGFFFLFTQYLQFVRGYSPLNAGVATLPLAVTLVLVSPRSAALAERFGAGRVIAVGFAFLLSGFSVLASVDPSTPYLLLALAIVLLGCGMGITVAPATGGIMASVPINRAGIGSAVNDTTRELGGALGIAVLGSIVSSVYRGEVDVTGLPPAAQAAAGESMGAAAAVADRLGGAAGAALHADAAAAFTNAFNAAMGTAAVVAVVAGVAVWVVLGRRRMGTVGAPAGAGAGAPVSAPVPSA